ncbi:hypothetical protein, conserved [Babesia ovata]|uniref:C3H1-type domain-containing protein n=1 Tax=Babesia ovata TaxID=189622 RepID=A0A2H6KAI3_9APIC|nr:uncharacterized protein BOVATA_014880 [Babesia ovata]GBE59995.1 hypothetical protein, conserved [Babesia ovata]
MAIYADTVIPLVALAPLPAAHRRRPPRRPEDTLPPEIALKPPHRRAVPPRRRTRQGTRQRQVKNGGGGLDKLAEALKKLIEGAISSATSSLEKRRKELLCADKYDNEHHNKHCQTLLGEIEKEKEYKDEDKISKARSKYDDHYNDVHYLTEDARKGALGDIEERQKTLDKLKKDLEKFIGKEDKVNPATEILKNLTDGLEKFLGYQETSKGYDGSGIVYSDLDRLCDGVMAFLHGVLKDVFKNQPYDVGKTTLNSATDDIKKEFWKGQEGLKKAIQMVTGRLSSYSMTLTNYNNKLTGPINVLLRHVKEGTSEDIRKIPDAEKIEKITAHEIGEKVKESVSLASRYAGYGARFEHDIARLGKQIKDLNKDLQLNIKYAGENVSYETKRLERLAQKEDYDLKVMEKEITEMVAKCATCVNDRICKDVTEFVKLLKDKVSEIQSRLDQINRSLYQYVNELQQWIKTADKSVTQAKSKAEEIEFALPGGRNRDVIKDIANQLNDRSGVLCRYIDDVKKEIKQKVTAALEAVKEMDAQLKQDLHGVREAIKSKVDAITERIGELYGVVNGGEETSKDTIFDAINLIRESVKGVAGEVSRNKKTGVTGIVSHVKFNYASQFYTNFQSAIGNMVDKLTGNGLVNIYINDYAGDPSGKNGKGATVKAAIRNHIESIIVKNKPNTNGENVHIILQSVERYLEGYAAAVDPSSNVNAIAEKVKLEDKVKLLPRLDEDTNFKFALKTILTAVHCTTLRVKDDLAKFTHGDNGYNFGKCLNAASTTAEGLEQKLGDALGRNGGLSSGQPGTAQAVDTAIKAVGTELDAQLKNGTASKVDIQNTGENVFQNYKTHVKQESLTKAESNIDQLEGALPEKIKEIKTYAESGFSVDPTREALANWSTDITSNLESLRSELSASGKALKEQLKTFKDTISKDNPGKEGLQKIQKQISDLQKQLEKGPLKLADDFLKGVDPSRNKYIKKLQDYVNEQTENVSKQAKMQARKQYISSIRELLTEFCKKVEAELSKLPQQIEDDLKTGYKGFVKKMETHLLPGLTIPPDTPLKTAASTVKSKMTSFMEQLQNQEDFKKSFETVKPSHNALLELLQQLHDSEHFGHLVPPKVQALRDGLSELLPKQYKEESQPMLDTLKKGYYAFAGEVNKAYLNVYEAATPIEKWVTEDSESQTSQLTPDGKRCAKACLSIVPTLFTALTELKSGLEKKNGKRKTYKIYDLKGSAHSLRNLFFADNGYDTDLPDGAEHGELNHKADFKGEQIYEHLVNTNYKLFSLPSSSATGAISGEPTFEFTDENGVLSQLHNYLKLYFNVCHTIHIDKPRTPCNIYEMLLWCSGLQFNSVYHPLLDHVRTLFPVDDESQPPQKILQPIVAYPHNFTREDACSAIEHVSENAYLLLTGILGTGDAECNYASDFSTNFLKLKYPSRGEDCLHTLLDILRRLFPALQFLQSKCSQPATDFGWGDCLYGKGVPTAKTECDEHSTDESTCLPSSPLMSFLGDSLPGHLPHQVSSVGCKSICSTCPNSGPGVPCMTPLGFRAFSGSTKKGRDICDIIREFLGNEYIPALFSLVPKPPFTLPEHFSFTLSLVKGWHKTKTQTRSLIKQSVESSINDMSIALCEDPSNLTDALTDAYGADCSKCEHAHVTNLTSSGYCGIREKDVACAPYLSSLSSAVYRYMAEKHGKLYLSWAIYLPWSFHNYLRELLEAFTAIFCEDWGCRSCLQSSNCRRGKHGLSEKKDGEDAKPHCQCTSIAKCKGVTPTFYHYGFIIPDAWTLHEEGTRKTCSNFYDELKNIVESKYFTKLFEACDDFLKEIRWPFMLTLLALWSLSLLYLLHIAVVRLDVLRIRSHLRSPSSHRIAAQSLLAAARVKALANVKYFSP